MKELVGVLEECGLVPCLARRVLLYNRHPLLAALTKNEMPGAQVAQRQSRGASRWCCICGERSNEMPLFRCRKTLYLLCEACLMEERCCWRR